MRVVAKSLYRFSLRQPCGKHKEIRLINDTYTFLHTRTRQMLHKQVWSIFSHLICTDTISILRFFLLSCRLQSQFERSLKGLPCFWTQHAQLSKNITSIRKHDMKLKLLRSPRRVKCLNTEHGVDPR